tara:strand:+ start:290 stop:472 length:183 start_codon:yes stop_codon:yes gene_type:complete
MEGTALVIDLVCSAITVWCLYRQSGVGERYGLANNMTTLENWSYQSIACFEHVFALAVFI